MFPTGTPKNVKLVPKKLSKLIPYVFFVWSIPFRVAGGILAATAWKAGRQSITERTQTNERDKRERQQWAIALTHWVHLESPINLTCVSLDRRREPAQLDRTHVCTVDIRRGNFLAVRRHFWPFHFVVQASKWKSLKLTRCSEASLLPV